MIVETCVHIALEDPAISAIVGDRVFPRNMPDGVEFPAIVVTKTTGLGSYTTSGDAGIEEARVQFDCYALGYANMIELRNAVRRLFSGFKGGRASGSPCSIDSSFCINDIDLAASETLRAGPKLNRRMIEFRIWNREV